MIALVIWIADGGYVQEHLNRVWDAAATGGAQPAARRRRLRSRPEPAYRSSIGTHD